MTTRTRQAVGLSALFGLAFLALTRLIAGFHFRLMFSAKKGENMKTESENNHQKETRPRGALPLGIALGTAVGAGIGAATDNLALWIALGVLVGVAIGAILEQQGG